MARIAAAGSVLIAWVALGGCSSLGASPAPTPVGGASSGPSRLAQAQATHEYPAQSPPPQTAASPSPSAVIAARTFALAYINWNADTAAAQMRRLANRSIGQARSTMQLAATQAAGDYELRRGGIANHGSVEAVAPLRGAGSRYVVVTRESTTATLSTAYQGLRPAWHVAVASVSQLAPGRWVVSGWRPES